MLFFWRSLCSLLFSFSVPSFLLVCLSAAQVVPRLQFPGGVTSSTVEHLLLIWPWRSFFSLLYFPWHLLHFLTYAFPEAPPSWVAAGLSCALWSVPWTQLELCPTQSILSSQRPPALQLLLPAPCCLYSLHLPVFLDFTSQLLTSKVCFTEIFVCAGIYTKQTCHPGRGLYFTQLVSCLFRFCLWLLDLPSHWEIKSSYYLSWHFRSINHLKSGKK